MRITRVETMAIAGSLVVTSAIAVISQACSKGGSGRHVAAYTGATSDLPTRNFYSMPNRAAHQTSVNQSAWEVVGPIAGPDHPEETRQVVRSVTPNDLWVFGVGDKDNAVRIGGPNAEGLWHAPVIGLDKQAGREHRIACAGQDSFDPAFPHGPMNSQITLYTGLTKTVLACADLGAIGSNDAPSDWTVLARADSLYDHGIYPIAIDALSTADPNDPTKSYFLVKYLADQNRTPGSFEGRDVVEDIAPERQPGVYSFVVQIAADPISGARIMSPVILDATGVATIVAPASVESMASTRIADFPDIAASMLADTRCSAGMCGILVGRGPGGLLDCGSAPAGSICVNNMAVSTQEQSTCTPLAPSVACAAAADGVVPCIYASNGCGGTVSCPSACPASQSCGGGGQQYSCGARPLTADALRALFEGDSPSDDMKLCGHRDDVGDLGGCPAPLVCNLPINPQGMWFNTCVTPM